MNKDRRKRINEVIEDVRSMMTTIEEIRGEEEEARENLPESLQEGGQGQGMQDAASSMESAIDQLSDVEGLLEEATQ